MGGVYFISPTQQHLNDTHGLSKVDNSWVIRPLVGQIYICSVQSEGGFGVGQAACCDTKASDPLSATRASQFGPIHGYTTYYDCFACLPPSPPPPPPRTMVITETTATIVLGDATLTDANETEKIIDALTLQYNTASVKDAGAKVSHTPPSLSTPSPHPPPTIPSPPPTTTHHHSTLPSVPR